VDVFEQVRLDLGAREAIGASQHGGRELDALEPGRDWLREAYEECLDMAVYLKAELARRAAEDSGALDFVERSAALSHAPSGLAAADSRTEDSG
jgi:hypothetical protein